MMTNPIYYVQAYRGGKIDNHSYVVGIFTDGHTAQAVAKKEEEFRGGKYECVVYIADLNEPIESYDLWTIISSSKDVLSFWL